MKWRRYKLKVLSCFIILLTFVITGCTTSTPSIVNTHTLSKNDDPVENKPTYEVIKLNSGVVIYRDRSTSKKSSSDYQASSAHFNFGPREVSFDPDPVFKNK